MKRLTYKTILTLYGENCIQEEFLEYVEYTCEQGSPLEQEYRAKIDYIYRETIQEVPYTEMISLLEWLKWKTKGE